MIVDRRDLIANDPLAARLLDRVGAFLLIIVFLPFMAVIAAGIAMSSRGPIFFKQQRIGRDGRLFWCYKFRTMDTNADAQLKALLEQCSQSRSEWDRDRKLKDDPRVFAFGRFLRRSSLDELPQLFNILRGEMSLVGPRPIVESEAEMYGRYIVYYCAVRPGLTGLWQVSGRNDTSYRRRVALDVVYARQGRVGDNIGILMKTVPAVLVAKGSY
ncbi:MAG: sugar transferase [Pseudomonadota bacterium]